MIHKPYVPRRKWTLEEAMVVRKSRMPVPRGMHQDLAKSNPPKYPPAWRVTGELATRPDYRWVAYVDTAKVPVQGHIRRMFWPRVHSDYPFEWHPAWGFVVHPQHAHGWRTGIMALDRVWRGGLEAEATGTILHRIEWPNATVEFSVEKPWPSITCFTIRRKLRGGKIPLTMRWTSDWAHRAFEMWDGLLDKFTEHRHSLAVDYNASVTQLSNEYDE